MTAGTLGLSDRALRILTATRRALVRNTAGDSRLPDMCRVLAEVARYRSVAVGEAGRDPLAPPQLIARAQYEGDVIRVASWPPGEGPAVSKAGAEAFVLPVERDGRRVGVLEVQPFAGEALHARDIPILREIADDLCSNLPVPVGPAPAISKGLLSVAIDEVEEGIYLMKGDSPLFMWVNKSAAQSLGYSREELCGGMGVMDIDDQWTPAMWDRLIPEIQARRRFTIETTHRTRSGRLIPVEVTGNYFDCEGRSYNMAIVRDISERREAEARARSRDVEYRSLADNTPDFVIRWDRDLRRVYVNPAFVQAAGLPVDDVAGTPLGSEYAPDVSRRNTGYVGDLSRMVREVFDTGEPRDAELTWFGTNGQRIVDHRMVAERGLDGSVETVLCIGRDITRIKTSERQFRSLTEHSPDIIARVDQSARYLYANRAFEVVAGAPSSQLVGRRLGERASEQGHRQLQAAMAALGDLVRAVVESGQPAETTLDTDTKDRKFLFDVRLIPEHDDSGRVASVLVVARDVSSRRKLEDQLRQAQKMEAVGQLAGGVAHDFNNLLAVIQMQASLLLDDAQGRPEFQEGAREILAATDRGANLTRQLLTFSRRQVTRPEDLNIADVIGTTTKLLRRVLGEDVRLETGFAPTLPLIHADAGMIEQVLMNLAINARDAMPDGGRLEVLLTPVTVSNETAVLHPGVAPGPFIRLSVADTGCGIPPEALPHVFEPFFTTKEVGKGTGLGLATVFGIVQQHKGWVDVESRVGDGTTFHVYLPALATPAAAPSVRAISSAVPRGTETVLFVEDEPVVRMIVRKQLERLGYTVLAADSVADALELWKTDGDRVDLLVTDVVLPGGRSGNQLVEELTALRPDLPVIYTTGYSPEFVSGALSPARGHMCLQKPFTASDLASTVRRALDERARAD